MFNIYGNRGGESSREETTGHDRFSHYHHHDTGLLLFKKKKKKKPVINNNKRSPDSLDTSETNSFYSVLNRSSNFCEVGRAVRKRSASLEDLNGDGPRLNTEGSGINHKL